MSSSPILQKAKRLHRAHERRMVDRGLQDTARTWGELTGDEQAELMELATIIHFHRDMHTRDLAVLLCEHYGREIDSVLDFERRIREAKGPCND